MRKKLLKSKRGFSMVEMLTVLTILVIVGLSFSLAFKQISRSVTSVRISQEMVDQIHISSNFFRRDVENAFVAPVDTRYVFDGSNTAVNFNAMGLNASGNYRVIEIGYRYDAAAGALIRRVQDSGVPDADVTTGGPDEVILDNLTACGFRYGYKNSSGALVYLSAGDVWDSRVENYANYDLGGDPINVRDQLPHIVELNYTIVDANSSGESQDIVLQVYLEQS